MLRKELAWNKQLPHYGETYKLVTIRENGEVDGLVSLDLAEQYKESLRSCLFPIFLPDDT